MQATDIKTLRGRLPVVAIIVLLSARLLAEATVKKSDGQIITGDIKGFIVQKGEDVDGATHTISYNLIPGDIVSSIDEDGVSIIPGRTLKVVVVRQAPPKDDAFNLAFADKFLEMDFDVNMDIADVGPFAVRKFDGRNLTDRLIGEFRGESGQRVLRPDIQVTTPSGMIAVPVDVIVAFRPR